jgi:hypothetical protein
MKRRILFVFLLFVLGISLFSCGSDQTRPLDVDAVRTEAVATYASSLTGTLDAAPPASPTPTAEPTSTPVIETVTLEPSPTTNPCFNLMYLKDVTIPDGTEMKSGEVFTKTWQVQNIGGCAWRAGFTFRHVGGDPMSGQPLTLTEAIPTGAIRELAVQLVVPGGVYGVIQSAWRMADQNGYFFGDTLTVEIVVRDPNAPTATGTP